MEKFNVIYLHTHDTGRGIEPYDPGIHTPCLKQLAMEGVLFRNAYCVNPTCSPSRSGLLTGQYPHENGMFGLAHRGFSLNDYKKHIASYLTDCGYETALIGVQHEADDEKKLGYGETYVRPRSDFANQTLYDIHHSDKAVEFVMRQHEKPFFLSYGLRNTHKPYPKPDEDIHPDFVKVPYCLPDTPQTRQDYAGFLTAARHADACIGKVIQAVRKAGLWDKTILLYTTDHGIALPHMKCTLYDVGIGVSLILSAPGFRCGQAVDGMVSHLDIFPSLCEFLGLEKPGWLRGISFLPMLNGRQKEIRDAVYAEINYHAARDPQRMVRTKQYKYIRRYAQGELHYIPCNVDSGPSKDYLAKHGLFEWRLDREQLYDLVLDPAERVNLAADPAYKDVMLDMQRRLYNHMNETMDTIEEAGLPKVPGARLNRTDCYDPESKDPESYE